jgi:hypothetical protein
MGNKASIPSFQEKLQKKTVLQIAGKTEVFKAKQFQQPVPS